MTGSAVHLRSSGLRCVALLEALLFTACGGDSGGSPANPQTAISNARAADGGVRPPLNCPVDSLALNMVDVGELKLNVACQGSGPTLVLLHGYPEFYQSWSALVPPLVSMGYRVVVPDQRGYNLSDKPADVPSYQIDHLVADAAGLIAASGSDPVVLVGHDWGGTVAWVLAHRHPELVRGLVVMAGPHPDVWGHPEVDAAQAMASANYIPLIASPAGEAIFAGKLDSFLSAHLDAEQLAAYHTAWQQPNAEVSMNNWYRANLSPTVTLPTEVTVDQPTLVTWGMKDTFTLASELQYIPNYVKNLTVHVWPDADHWLLFQNVDETVKLIVDFEHTLKP